MDIAHRYETEAAIYGCLQGLYTYPMSSDKLSALRELGSMHSRINKHLVFLRNLLDECIDQDNFLERLDVEFTRLFVGPGQNSSPPYASFYLNNAMLMGAEASAVRSIYLDWGMAPVELGRIPDDHISLELAFMGYLSSEAHEALADKDVRRMQVLSEAQAGFMHDQLLTWVPGFCSSVIAATEEDFFAGLARLTQTQLEVDASLLDEMIAASARSE